jgi:hypothetical protein
MEPLIALGMVGLLIAFSLSLAWTIHLLWHRKDKE